MSGPLHYPSLGCERATSHPRKFLLHAFQIQTWVHFFSLLHLATLSEDDDVCCRIWFNACASFVFRGVKFDRSDSSLEEYCRQIFGPTWEGSFLPSQYSVLHGCLNYLHPQMWFMLPVSFHWQQLFQTSDKFLLYWLIVPATVFIVQNFDCARLLK